MLDQYALMAFVEFWSCKSVVESRCIKYPY